MRAHIQLSALAIATFLVMAALATDPAQLATDDSGATREAARTGPAGSVTWQPTDVRVSAAETLFPGPQRNLYEPHIAFDPVDPNTLVAFAIDLSAQNANAELYSTLRAYRSIDGGASWTDEGAMAYDAGGTLFGGGDPVVTPTPGGELLFASLADAPDDSVGGIWVHRSSDGGATWTLPVLAVAEEETVDGTCPSTDKEWITAAPDGTLYITYTEFLHACEPIVQDPVGAVALAGIERISVRLVTSHDGGATWSAPTTLWDAYALGSMPRVTPEGTLLVAFWSTTLEPAGLCPFATSAVTAKAGGRPFSTLVIGRSADAGSSWSFHQQPVCVPDLAFALKPAFMPGGNFLPALTVDPSTGGVFVAYPEYVPLEQRFTVRLITSQDDALSWSGPTTVTPGPLDARMPTLLAHDGALRLAYVVTSDADETGWLAYAESLDGGAAWSPPTALSSATWDLAPTPDLGDYIGLAVQDGRIAVIWTDARNGSPTEIWMRSGTINGGGA